MPGSLGEGLQLPERGGWDDAGAVLVEEQNVWAVVMTI